MSKASGRHNAGLDPFQLLLLRAVEARFGLKLQSGLYSKIIGAGDELVVDGYVAALAEIVDTLDHAGDDHPVVRHMREAASVGETYFYRGPVQLTALQDLVRKEILPRKLQHRNRIIRAWSAACATGEEAYTLAQLLRLTAPDFDIHVLGTDMNQSSLMAAKAGVFRQKSFREVKPVTMPGAFIHRGESWEVSPTLRQLVSFKELNLVTDDYPSAELGIGSFDIVLCRNVLIYIDNARLPSVMAKIAKSCARHAVVVVTPSEYSAAKHLHGFTDITKGLLWRGAKSSGRASSDGSDLHPHLGHHRHRASREAVRGATEASRASFSTSPEARSEVRRSGGADESSPRTRKRESEPLPKHPAASSANLRVPQAQPRSEPTRGAGAPREIVAEASAMANRGDFVAAEASLAAVTQAHPELPDTYYLLGHIALARGDIAHARQEFQRTLYFDPAFLPAVFGLADAMMKEHRLDEACKLFKRAVRILSNLADDDDVPWLELKVSAARKMATGELHRLEKEPE